MNHLEANREKIAGFIASKMQAAADRRGISAFEIARDADSADWYAYARVVGKDGIGVEMIARVIETLKAGCAS